MFGKLLGKVKNGGRKMKNLNKRKYITRGMKELSQAAILAGLGTGAWKIAEQLEGAGDDSDQGGYFILPNNNTPDVTIYILASVLLALMGFMILACYCAFTRREKKFSMEGGDPQVDTLGVMEGETGVRKGNLPEIKETGNDYVRQHARGLTKSKQIKTISY